MHLRVRNALFSDIPQLTALKPIESLHMDRLILALADPGSFRYLVLERNGNVAGFVCLLLSFPDGWPTVSDASLPFPRIIDLFISSAHRGQGLGTFFLEEIEEIAAETGASSLHLSVDCVDNPRAQALYQRCGYLEIGTPVDTHWNFTDSDGQIHYGQAVLQEMSKLLEVAEVAASGCSGESELAA